MYLAFPGLFWFYAQHEGEFGGILQAIAGLKPVETNTVVEAKQTKHGQEETHTQTHTATKAEWIVFFHAEPTVGRFKEAQGENGAAGIEAERVANFGHILIENGEVATGALLIRVDPRIAGLVNGIAPVCDHIKADHGELVAHARITHLESFEG